MAAEDVICLFVAFSTMYGIGFAVGFYAGIGVCSNIVSNQNRATNNSS